ncbi:MAG: SMC-Scp complex subunit ScpB [Chitinophagales bacterium]|nr:SMC-Scp complex subunit ScpB [Chitinophagales bacterium]MCZ2392821.1 SMC-Scp complex subunit ScpB [Chitinophagales bacterium]
MNIRTQIEAILFSAEQPITIEELTDFFTKYYGVEYQHDDLIAFMEEAISFYDKSEIPFTVIQIGGGYLFKSKSDFHPLISSFLQRNSIKRLTVAALETLAVIAYKQPVTKTEIELIRGVNCDYTVQKLMEKELIELKGRSEEVGRPLLYGTTYFFLDYFGINNLDELPKLKEFIEIENQIGEKENIIR